MESYIEENRKKIIILDSTKDYEKQIELLDQEIELLLVDEENYKEELAWCYYWLARSTYKHNRNNLHCKFKEIEKALKQSLNYKCVIEGQYKADISWQLALLYKKVCPNEKYNEIINLYLDSANYYYRIYEDMHDYKFLKLYADIYNNLANFTNDINYIEISLEYYKILLKSGYKNKEIKEEIEEVYATACDVYFYNDIMFKYEYYYRKIKNITLLHNLNNNKITNEIG